MWDKVRGVFGKKPEAPVRKGIPLAIPENIAGMFSALPDIELPEQYQENHVEPCQCEKDFDATGAKRGMCELCGSVPGETSEDEPVEHYFLAHDDSEQNPSSKPRRGWVDENEEN